MEASRDLADLRRELDDEIGEANKLGLYQDYLRHRFRRC